MFEMGPARGDRFHFPEPGDGCQDGTGVLPQGGGISLDEGAEEEEGEGEEEVARCEKGGDGVEEVCWREAGQVFVGFEDTHCLGGGLVLKPRTKTWECFLLFDGK